MEAPDTSRRSNVVSMREYKALILQRSEADGAPLPRRWCEMTTYQKGFTIQWLQGKRTYPLVGFEGMTSVDRARVVDHLVAVGSIGAFDAAKYYGTNARVPPSTRDSYGLYPRPNGGRRILPSMYTKLTDFWVRGNGTPVRIEDMNTEHIQNCLKLLKESYLNLIARSADVLGKVHAHFDGMVSVPNQLERVSDEIQTYDVDQVYPVWRALSEELQKRLDEREEAPKRVSNDEDLVDLLRRSLQRGAWPRPGNVDPCRQDSWETAKERDRDFGRDGYGA